MNQAKLAALVEHLTEGGSLDAADVAAVIGCTVRSTKTIEKYLVAAEDEDDNLEDLVIGGTHYYSDDPEEAEEGEDPDPEEEEEEEEEEDPKEEEADPEEEEEEEEDEPLVPKKVKPAPNKPYRFFIEGASGASSEIERVDSKSKGKIITFKHKAITDFVSIMIKGAVETVDIIPLRLENPRHLSDFGITNELLLNLALAAKP